MAHEQESSQGPDMAVPRRGLLKLAGAGSLSLLGGVSGVAGSNDSNAAANPIQANASVDSTDVGEIIWHDIADEINNVDETYPTVINDVMIIGGRQFLYGYDAVTGERLWEIEHSNFGFRWNHACLEDVVVYISGEGGDRSITEIRALSLDGNEHWRIDRDDVDFDWHISSPVVVDEVLYISDDHTVYAFDIANEGELLWDHDYDSTKEDVPEEFGESDFGSSNSDVVVVNGVVYAASGDWDNKIYAIDTESGERLWAFQSENNVDFDGYEEYGYEGGICTTPVVAEGKVVFGVNSPGRALIALDTETGTVEWEYEFQPENTISGNTERIQVRDMPTIYDGKVFFSPTVTKYAYAFDLDSGEVIWEMNPEKEIDDPDIPNDVTNDGYTTSRNTVAGGVVYWEAVGGPIYALDAETGELLWWEQPFDLDVAPHPIVVDGVLYSAWFNRITALNVEGTASSADLRVQQRGQNHHDRPVGDDHLREYVDPETDRIETDGLRDAIDDWRDGTITTNLLRDVIAAWRSGEQIE